MLSYFKHPEDAVGSSPFPAKEGRGLVTGLTAITDMVPIPYLTLANETCLFRNKVRCKLSDYLGQFLARHCRPDSNYLTIQLLSITVLLNNIECGS